MKTMRSGDARVGLVAAQVTVSPMVSAASGGSTSDLAVVVHVPHLQVSIIRESPRREAFIVAT